MPLKNNGIMACGIFVKLHLLISKCSSNVKT
jgi:hypothetical protein